MEYATHRNSVNQFLTKSLLLLSAGKIKFSAGFLCFKIISCFWKSVNEVNLWKNFSWKTPKSKLRKDYLSTIEENGSVMLIWVLHSSFSSEIDAG